MTFTEIIQQPKPVLVDFFATWCGPCKLMTPILSDVKQQLGETATIIKIDVDVNPNVASVYGIQSIPTLLLFKNGEVIWRKTGVATTHELVTLIKQNV